MSRLSDFPDPDRNSEVAPLSGIAIVVEQTSEGGDAPGTTVKRRRQSPLSRSLLSCLWAPVKAAAEPLILPDPSRIHVTIADRRLRPVLAGKFE
jgi:hypothetical protein